MAEIDFFATDREKTEYLRPLFDSGFRIIPDLRFEKPVAPKLRGTDELLRYTDRTSQFFIVNDKLLKSSLEYRRVEREGNSFFYIFPRSGGPLLVFFWGKHESRKGGEVFAATTLSYYPWYEDSITHERVKPSPDLIRAYNDVASRIRDTSRRVKPGVRVYWLTPAVEQFVRRGAVLIGLEAFQPNQILGGAHSECR
jgi:hypothetical protein